MGRIRLHPHPVQLRGGMKTIAVAIVLAAAIAIWVVA